MIDKLKNNQNGSGFVINNNGKFIETNIYARRYKAILKSSILLIIVQNADYVKYVCKHYPRSCYRTRNVWMVDRSSRVIAAYNGEKGGTKNTIDYAKRVKVGVHNILGDK